MKSLLFGSLLVISISLGRKRDITNPDSYAGDWLYENNGFLKISKDGDKFKLYFFLTR
jgi:hypothetical protein